MSLPSVKYIKCVTGIDVFFEEETSLTKRFRLYASPYEKYGVWNSFTKKVARESLWAYGDGLISSRDLFTEKKLKERFKIKLNKANKLVKMAHIVVKLSDGTSETRYFDDDREAVSEVYELVNKYKLMTWVSINSELYEDLKLAKGKE